MISIIIPIYNAANCVGLCLSSVAKQRYKDWECLLINDGSTDGSDAECDRWAAADRRFRVFRQSRQGVSAARNRGLQECQGELVCFVDADDWLDADYLEKMIPYADNVAIVVSGQIREFGNGKCLILKPSHTRTFVVGEDDALTFLELCNTMLLYACHEKIYHTNIIKKHHVKFPEGCNYGEDLLFNLNYLEYATHIATIDSAYYHYRIGNNTLSTTLRLNQFEQDYEQWKVLEQFFQQHHLLNQTAQNYLYQRLWGIVYDGIFLYPQLHDAGISYLKKVLSIPEIHMLREFQDVFSCSWWIKNSILKRLYMVFYLYFAASTGNESLCHYTCL